MYPLLNLLNGYAEHVKAMPTWGQLSTTTLLPIPVYLVIGYLMSWVSGEYSSSNTESMKRQIWHSTRSLAILSPIAAMWHYAMLNGYMGKIYWDVEEFGWPYFASSLLLYLAIMDTIFYWSHRLLHVGRFYLLFHAEHHQYHPTTTFSASAVDFVDILDSALITVCSAPLLIPIHISVYHAWMWIGLFWSMYLHNRNLTFIPPGGWWNNSEDHETHHRTGRFNFSMFTLTWDYICGTYHDGCKRRVY